MIRLHLRGIGILGEGLTGWTVARAILAGEQTYQQAPLQLEPPEILEGRERRRSSATVRLALNVSSEAVAQSGLAATELAVVFGSSAGSGTEVHQILQALTLPGMPVSPTQFHNSVHNASVGYWCIGTGCHQPSTSIAGYDMTFPAALLKAAAQAASEALPVLLTVTDCPFPEPLHSKRPISAPFGVALVLTPQAGAGSLATLTLDWQTGNPAGGISEPRTNALREIWQGNPAGRAIPLLELLARREAGAIALRYPETGHLRVEVAPC